MMIKKIMLLIGLVFFTACSSSKPVVRTTNKMPNRQTGVVRKVKQPVARTPEEKRVASHPKEESVAPRTEILEATTRVKVTTALVLEYIDKYKAIAKEDMIKYGIPASITLGQGILESGAGTGPLSMQANNHFGIKCHKEWTGESVKHDDDEAQECFRKYANPEESYRDHSIFLSTRKYYVPLFKLEKSDYKAWSQGLKDCGYATDKAYPTKLISLIERYDLHRFDAEVLGVAYVPVKKEPVKKELNQKEPIKKEPIQKDPIQKVAIPRTDSIAANSEELYTVIKGDTLYSISKRYNISIDDLKKKNNIVDNNISLGQSLQIK